jgi:hypothetical protein
MSGVVCDILQVYKRKVKEVISMSEKANPAIVAAAVVLLVLVIGFMGWKFLGPGSKAGGGQNPYGNAAGSNGPPSQYMPHSDGSTGTNVPPGNPGGPSSYGGPGSGGPGSGGQ